MSRGLPPERANAAASLRRPIRSGCASAAAVGALLAGGPAWAHPGAALPQDVWSAWSLEPAVFFAIGLSALLYARGVGRLWRRAGVGRGIRRWRFACFAAGLAVLFVALVSPLDAMGGALFSAHMVQHELLMLVAAPLLVLGLPMIPFLWALPIGWRRGLGRLAKAPPVAGGIRALTHPLAAWTLYAAALWTWHAPELYQATLRSDWIHTAQHASFTGSALLFWWVLLHPPRMRRGEYGTSILFVFTTAVHGSLLGALLTFAREPWYPAYAPTAAAWGLSPLEDQQLGGLIMWVPPGLLYLGIALVALGLWLRGIDRRARRGRERTDPTDEDRDVVPLPA